jgi:hypothetical protein
MSETIPAVSSGQDAMQMDAHLHVQDASDHDCAISADLVRSLAERARASRFRRYLDRVADDPALASLRGPRAAGPHGTPPSLLS